MVNKEYEWPNCWIRGEMDSKDYQDDPVRLATIDCPFRKGNLKAFFFGTKIEMDYHCTHPAIKNKDEVEGPRKLADGGIMFGGGIDEYKTFCIPVDMHLTSLGESSALAIDVTFTNIDDEQFPNPSNPKLLRPKLD